MDLVVEGLLWLRQTSDQTSPVTKLPLKLVVEGLRPSDQTFGFTLNHPLSLFTFSYTPLKI